MGDHQHRARVLQQRIFQRAQRFHVQVVRGFVQQQHVAALDQRLGQVQAAALAAGEVADLLLLVLSVEVEAACVGARGHLELADVDDVQPARDVFPHRLVVGQRVTRLLHIGHLDRLAHDDFAGIGLLTPRDQLEQRGLAGAVGADDADDGASGDVHGQVVDEHAVAKALGDVVELDDLRAQALGHGNEDFLGFIALLVFEIAQFLEARDTGLGLGLAALGVLANPLQFLLQGLGTGFLALLLGLQAVLLLDQPLGVVALVGNAVATVQFQDPLGSVVQEVAIVGDGHHGAGEAVQELLQPFHGLGVQVVGGLVQQQHVGLGQQQLAQRHAALLAAGQLADHGVPGRQAQGVGGDLQLVLGVGAGSGDLGFQLALLGSQRVEVGVGLGVGGVDFIEARAGRVDFGHGLFHGLAHRVLWIELRLLRQIADGQALHGQRLAFEFLVHPGHDLEQRGLARAVQTQHADLGAREKAERDILQDLPLGRHGLGEVVHRKNVLSHSGPST
ncbi:MAG: hypothetical protein GAK34_02062 [Delftia tsuruhatensis]|nr:MAG: hypothetical protein GAK34_02062 [Delftia tsuruhatensis]